MHFVQLSLNSCLVIFGPCQGSRCFVPFWPGWPQSCNATMAPTITGIGMMLRSLRHILQWNNRRRKNEALWHLDSNRKYWLFMMTWIYELSICFVGCFWEESWFLGLWIVIYLLCTYSMLHFWSVHFTGRERSYDTVHWNHWIFRFNSFLWNIWPG